MNDPIPRIALGAAGLFLIIALYSLWQREIMIAGMSFLFLSFSLFIREKFKT